ncbi:unnamed protein product [Lactuca virosa]|uniref:Uncharacterized protein n=1 Tax=Lactuca virosa TaxID=75947 RepID=A0AAU9MK21_9ASTR|nr:unnamed protein product [Lactuca virosa]
MHKNRFIRGSPPRSRQIHEPIIDSIPQINKSNRCLKNHSDPCTRPPLREMRKHAVERSQCQLVDLTLVDFANHELLLYIADRENWRMQRGCLWVHCKKLKKVLGKGILMLLLHVTTWFIYCCYG